MSSPFSFYQQKAHTPWERFYVFIDRRIKPVYGIRPSLFIYESRYGLYERIVSLAIMARGVCSARPHGKNIPLSRAPEAAWRIIESTMPNDDEILKISGLRFFTIGISFEDIRIAKPMVIHFPSVYEAKMNMQHYLYQAFPDRDELGLTAIWDDDEW